jgi:hypothetical protein
VKDLELTATEEALVDRILGTGRNHPWSDELTDEITDWMGSAALTYLKAGRDSAAVEAFVPRFCEFLDRIILERYESLRSAARDVHENPPYYSADRWPTLDACLIQAVIDRAFHDTREG